MAEISGNKEPKGTISIVCGIITIILGLAICFTSDNQVFAYVFLTLNIVLNLYLHCESYISNKKIGKSQSGVLTIIVVEVAFMVLLLVSGVQMFTQGVESFWENLMIVFSCYLVINGALLIAIPIKFAFYSGLSAIGTAVLVFIFADSWGNIPAIVLGVSFIVNGSERVVMAQLARVAKRKLTK